MATEIEHMTITDLWNDFRDRVLVPADTPSDEVWRHKITFYAAAGAAAAMLALHIDRGQEPAFAKVEAMVREGAAGIREDMPS